MTWTMSSSQTAMAQGTSTFLPKTRSRLQILDYGFAPQRSPFKEARRQASRAQTRLARSECAVNGGMAVMDEIPQETGEEDELLLSPKKRPNSPPMNDNSQASAKRVKLQHSVTSSGSLPALFARQWEKRRSDASPSPTPTRNNALKAKSVAENVVASSSTAQVASGSTESHDIPSTPAAKCPPRIPHIDLIAMSASPKKPRLQSFSPMKSSFRIVSEGSMPRPLVSRFHDCRPPSDSEGTDATISTSQSLPDSTNSAASQQIPDDTRDTVSQDISDSGNCSASRDIPEQEQPIEALRQEGISEPTDPSLSSILVPPADAPQTPAPPSRQSTVNVHSFDEITDATDSLPSLPPLSPLTPLSSPEEANFPVQEPPLGVQPALNLEAADEHDSTTRTPGPSRLPRPSSAVPSTISKVYQKDLMGIGVTAKGKEPVTSVVGRPKKIARPMGVLAMRAPTRQSTRERKARFTTLDGKGTKVTDKQPALSRSVSHVERGTASRKSNSQLEKGLKMKRTVTLSSTRPLKQQLLPGAAKPTSSTPFDFGADTSSSSAILPAPPPSIPSHSEDVMALEDEWSSPIYPPPITDEKAKARSRLLLSSLSDTLEKLALPAPVMPTREALPRPSTSMGFHRETSSSLQSSSSQTDPTHAVNVQGLGVSTSETIGLTRLIDRRSQTYLTLGGTGIGRQLHGHSSLPPMRFAMGGAGSNEHKKENRQRTIFGGAGFFKKPFPKASQKTSLDIIEGSPIRGRAGILESEGLEKLVDADAGEMYNDQDLKGEGGSNLGRTVLSTVPLASNPFNLRSSRPRRASISHPNPPSLPSSTTPSTSAHLQGPQTAPEAGDKGSGAHVKRKVSTRTKIPPGSSDILKDCVVFVDVRTEQGEDAGPLFVDMLRDAGAKVLTRVGQTCTHIVYKNGLASTLSRYRLLDEPRALLVGIGWVVECVEKRDHVAEEQFLVDLDSMNVAGDAKRRRSIIPRRICMDDSEPSFLYRRDADDSVTESNSSFGDGSTGGPSHIIDNLPPLERARRRSIMIPNTMS